MILFTIKFQNHENFQATFNPSNTQNFNSELMVSLPAENGLPPGGVPGSLLTKISVKDYDSAWVLPVDSVSPDENGPVMSSAVYAAILAAIDSIMGICSPVYYDTQQNWDSQTFLISERRAIYVYYDHAYLNDGHGNRYPVPAIKIGDGTSYLIDMPFVNDDVTVELARHINNTVIHVTQQEKDFWNNKVTCYLDETNIENLIFSKS